MGCFSPDIPNPPNPAQINRDTLLSQIELAPQKLEAEQFTRPGYDRLGLESLEHTFLGFDGDGDQPGQRGLLDLMENDILPVYQRAGAQAQELQRSSDLADLQKYGPGYVTALQAANPEQAELVSKVTARANEGLDQGLSAFEKKRFQQYYRGGNRGRVGNTGEAGASREAFYMMDRERDRDLQNRQLANQAVALNQSVYGDSFLQITGRPSGANAQGSALLASGQNQAGSAGPRLFSETNPLAYDLAGMGFNANVGAEINRVNNNNALLQEGISSVGAIAGAAAFACWVAREVFGPGNYKWMLFRTWLFTQAPTWFRDLYLRHGERFARWIQHRPLLKSIIRRWMERIIKHRGLNHAIV